MVDLLSGAAAMILMGGGLSALIGERGWLRADVLLAWPVLGFWLSVLTAVWRIRMNGEPPASWMMALGGLIFAAGIAAHRFLHRRWCWTGEPGSITPLTPWWGTGLGVLAAIWVVEHFSLSLPALPIFEDAAWMNLSRHRLLGRGVPTTGYGAADLQTLASTWPFSAAGSWDESRVKAPAVIAFASASCWWMLRLSRLVRLPWFSLAAAGALLTPAVLLALRGSVSRTMDLSLGFFAAALILGDGRKSAAPRGAWAVLIASLGWRGPGGLIFAGCALAAVLAIETAPAGNPGFRGGSWLERLHPWPLYVLAGATIGLGLFFHPDWWNWSAVAGVGGPSPFEDPELWGMGAWIACIAGTVNFLRLWKEGWAPLVLLSAGWLAMSMAFESQAGPQGYYLALPLLITLSAAALNMMTGEAKPPQAP
ncbi:MAG: hypothetical protein GMKNLPBB_02604 [Myxococcota bacterium]|nr:hypothetical protein [Myxococcota bacterium]